MAYAPKYDGFGGGWGTIVGGQQPTNSGTATAMGTMQTAALPTQALGSSQGAAFQRQNFGNTAAMATQNIADMQFKTSTPDVMKTQPAGTYANTYDPMATRAPQTQADPGYGGSGCGGRPSAYGGCGTQTMTGGYGPNGGYGDGYGGSGYAPSQGGYGGYGGGYGGAGGAGYGGSAAGYGGSGAAYGGSGCGGYQPYGQGGPGAYQQGYGGYSGYQNYGGAGGGYGGNYGAGAGAYGNYGYAGSQGMAPYGGYSDRGYPGMNDMVATQQLSAQQVYSREVPGSFATGGPGYSAYVSGGGGYPPGHPASNQMPIGRKPGRTRRSICC
eukprot:symbB.v1.2.003011.t1/scaffold113.1/size324549/9